MLLISIGSSKTNMALLHARQDKKSLKTHGLSDFSVRKVFLHPHLYLPVLIYTHIAE
jgi:hypothetical protein